RGSSAWMGRVSRSAAPSWAVVIARAGGSHAVRQSRPRPSRTSPSKSRTSSAERRGTMAGAVKRHRFTIDQYHRMGEAGILSEDEPVELIAGEIVVREPIGSRHAGTVNRPNRLWTSSHRALVVQAPRAW